MTGENAGSLAGSLAETLAGEIAGSEAGSPAESLASRFAYDVKYWTLEQAEAYPFWPPTEGDKMTEDTEDTGLPICPLCGVEIEDNEVRYNGTLVHETCRDADEYAATAKAEYKFHWVGTVKVFDGSRWAASTGIRGVFTRECDEAEAQLAFDENSDMFMDRDFLSGEYWLDGGGPGTDDWELHWFHVIIVDGPDGEISPENGGASR